MKKYTPIFLIAVAALFIIGFTIPPKKHPLPVADKNNGGLFLPGNFRAVAVVDSLEGRARHLAVNSNGDVYVKLRFPDSTGGNVALRDTNHDGKADIIKKFADYEDKGSYGTGMRVHKGYLYFSSEVNVYRTKLNPKTLVPDGPLELILHDTNSPHEHDAKPLAFDNKGHMYVAFGAPSNACQVQNRVPGSMGVKGCPLLKNYGGIWQFDEAKPNQQQKDGIRYATGLRSVVAMDWNTADSCLYVVAHGRDDLRLQFPKKFSGWQSAILPAEEFIKVKQGTDVGWPYYYYDPFKKKKLLNPEYGGDGKKVGNGAKYAQPIMAFQAHWAPNDLLFYTGNQFPERYKNGAFIAFHGSTNRSPYPQAGFFVCFVPFKNGVPTGKWEIFADGFAGRNTVVSVSDAVYRPMGLSMGPDGSLYISETEKGKVWRIFYQGDRTKFTAAQLSKMELRKKLPGFKIPDVMRNNLMSGMLGSGAKLYATYCANCHQKNGKGDGNLFPPLSGSEWVTGGKYMEKDLAIRVILNGLEGPVKVKNKPYNSVMPKHNFLSDDQIAKVLTYIRNNFGNNSSLVTASEVKKVRAESGGK
ncbi:PQQ-dependent sugar dehydrogenase [Mucilaginibacter sabulilitoris]|uniref:PQQ-dependent sugar dehydrogenase n=1 Tax=Mucilaginibacter sabulilitoris TaxID=1173583 RepID=A0ABZ0TNP1_9SPHI|nr:c-type cytochrome [Mucilaginibacter sabulilitoris]WPU93818.1 PQQ-dependent sugar dehydrogenase [Mucilaginibacter sabulilitoris]